MDGPTYVRALLTQLAVFTPGNSLRQKTINNDLWSITWYVGDRRVDHKLRENVLVIRDVTLAGRLRSNGYFTELLRYIIETEWLGRRRIDWIYVEQCSDRLARHLETALDFKIDRGLFLDCWRQTSAQKELPV